MSSHRQLIRSQRKDNAVPQISLVGYTNAGKSTLINALTNSQQRVHNGLFTTLDTLTKSLRLPDGNTVVVSDTVGFLHNLPHRLIEAFKATLEEVKEADLLLHILDISHPQIMERAKAVQQVINEINAEHVPMITVLNKIDAMADPALIHHWQHEFPGSLTISAQKGTNLDDLLAVIQSKFRSRMQSIDVLLPHTSMDLINTVYKEGKVINIEYRNEGIKLEAELPQLIANKILQHNMIQ
jgi:GTPase